jgi:hypothetical protein
MDLMKSEDKNKEAEMKGQVCILGHPAVPYHNHSLCSCTDPRQYLCDPRSREGGIECSAVSIDGSLRCVWRQSVIHKGDLRWISLVDYGFIYKYTHPYSI